METLHYNVTKHAISKMTAHVADHEVCTGRKDLGGADLTINVVRVNRNASLGKTCALQCVKRSAVSQGSPAKDILVSEQQEERY